MIGSVSSENPSNFGIGFLRSGKAFVFFYKLVRPIEITIDGLHYIELPFVLDLIRHVFSILTTE